MKIYVIGKVNAASFIRKMTKGGFKRKPNSWSYMHTNEDLLRIAKTDSLEDFVKRQQLRYVAHVVRKGNESTVKRLLFDNHDSLRPDPQLSLLTSVLKAEGMTLQHLCTRAKKDEI